jgi:hypothetical protein
MLMNHMNVIVVQAHTVSITPRCGNPPDNLNLNNIPSCIPIPSVNTNQPITGCGNLVAPNGHLRRSWGLGWG